MTHKATYPGIDEQTRIVGGATQRVHVISCECCDETLEIPLCGKRKPPDVLVKFAIRKGWTPKKKTFTCPEH